MRAKNNKLMILAIILSLVLVVVLSACVTDGESNSVKIDVKSDIKLVVGEQGKLAASVDYKTENKTLKFTSMNPALITIDQSGNYNALAVGKTKVKVEAYDGTYVEVIVTITELASEINYEVRETDVIIKEPTKEDLYYIFVQTSNEDKTFGPVNIETSVLPELASQDVSVAIDNENIAKVSSTGKVSIKLPKKGTTNKIPLKVTLSADNVSKDINFQVIPVDDKKFEFDFSRKINSQKYDNNNSEHKYILTIYNASFYCPFKTTNHVVVGNVDFVPDVTVKITLKNSPSIEIPCEIDNSNNRLFIRSVENIIEPRIPVDIRITVKENKTGLECYTDLTIFYNLPESIVTFLG